MTHGTIGGYVHHRCRCEACKRTYSRYMKRLRHERHLGLPSRNDRRLVSAAPAAEHVAALQADGMSFNAISIAAGYRSRNALRSVLAQQRCRPETLARILAVTSDRRPTGYTDATATVRRLRDLALLGWPAHEVGRLLGVSRWTVLSLVAGEHPRVRRSTAMAVLRLHAQIGGTPGPSPIAARRARAAAWSEVAARRAWPW